MQHIKIIKIILISLLFLFSCSTEENPVDPSETSDIRYPYPDTINGIATTNVLLLIRTTIRESGLELSLGVGAANFNNEDKGDVSANINGVDYIFAKNIISENTSYSFPDPNNPTNQMQLVKNKFQTKFVVSDLTLNVDSVEVPGEVEVTRPEEDETFSFNDTLQIKWRINDPGNHFAIALRDKNGKSRIKWDVANDSTASFKPSELTGLEAGELIVYVITYNYEFVNQQEVILIGESVGLKDIKLE